MRMRSGSAALMKGCRRQVCNLSLHLLSSIFLFFMNNILSVYQYKHCFLSDSLD
jgi:hypothetical protein